MTIFAYLSRSYEEPATRWRAVASLHNACLPVLRLALRSDPANWNGRLGSSVMEEIDAARPRLADPHKPYVANPDLIALGGANYYAAVTFLQQVRAWCLEYPDNFVRMSL